MNSRRLAIAFAALSTLAISAPAQAETWSLFDWTRPVIRGAWEQPVQTPVVVAPAPRRQRVATVVAPEPVRRPPVRMLIVGIGF